MSGRENGEERMNCEENTHGKAAANRQCGSIQAQCYGCIQCTRHTSAVWQNSVLRHPGAAYNAGTLFLGRGKKAVMGMHHGMATAGKGAARRKALQGMVPAMKAAYTTRQGTWKVQGSWQ